MSSGSGPLASVTRSGDGILQQPAPLCHSLPGGHPRSEASPPRQSRSNAGEILRLRPQDDKPAGWLPTPPFVMLSLSEASPYAGCHSNAGEILRVRAQDDKPAGRQPTPPFVMLSLSEASPPMLDATRTQERSFACALKMTSHTGWQPTPPFVMLSLSEASPPMLDASPTQERSFGCGLSMTNHTGW